MPEVGQRRSSCREPDATMADQRKGKKLQWKEAKICLAHPQGSRTLVYGGTLQGDVATAGQKLFDCAKQAGFGRGTHVHAVGDGAPWIAAQVEDQFGAQGNARKATTCSSSSLCATIWRRRKNR